MKKSLEFEPMRGLRPSLEFRPLGDLQIDPSYQRDVSDPVSGSLIRRIAQRWDWGLCQPLAVVRRPDGSLFVIDGQHRLCAARLRPDITDIPRVVSPSLGVEQEAASFVEMNRARRALRQLELFKGDVARGDQDALLLVEVMGRAGMTIPRTSNPDFWQPNQVSNIGGLRKAMREYGEGALVRGLLAMGRAWDGQVLRYAGTIFPGVARVPGEDKARSIDFDGLVKVLGKKSQVWWREEINRVRVTSGLTGFGEAAARAISVRLGKAVRGGQA